MNKLVRPITLICLACFLFFALNPEKINGVCGRLMCCLAYENESYFEYKKDLPKVGDHIKTKEGSGKVIYVDLFARKYKIETEEGQIIDIEK